MKPHPPPPAVRARQGLWLLVAMLVAVGLFGAWSRTSEYRQLEAEQGHLLATQARAAGVSVARQLRLTAQALRQVRDDLAERPVDEAAAQAARRLGAVGTLTPGVRDAVVLDRTGRLLAAAQPGPAGADLSAREDFRMARDGFDARGLWLSRPEPLAPGERVMHLAVAVTAADGGFGGIVAATLEAAYFREVLGAMLYAGDMRGVVIHGSGTVMLFEPAVADTAGIDVSQPGSMFSRHRAGGQVVSVLGGVSSTGETRLSALRTVQAEGAALDPPIVLAFSRDTEAMFAPWRRQSLAYAALYGLFIAMTGFAVLAMRRRQRDVDRLQAQQAALERQGADRLELALRGADLGLWDLHLPSGQATVNERWNTMLGLPHDPDCGTTGWQSRVHPDDWPRVSAAQQAHLDGHTERYEAVYRMRHADGRWIWILDRGQVLERDAHGAPLRMVGTHMDTSERMEAQLALQRSEQGLATTLNSIGDAVIATDPAGLVVRMNAAAQRLTGWPLAAAKGQPLGQVLHIVDARTRAPVVDTVRRVVETGQVIGLANDTVLVARDGSEHQIADSAAPIRTPEGQVTGVVLVFSDVTERYRVQQALRANEERLRSLLDNLRSGVVVHGADSQVLDANPSACRIIGLTLEQMRGKVAIDPYWQFIEENRAPMPLERFPVNQVLAGDGAVHNLVLGVRRPDLREPVWVLVNAYPTRGAEGRIEQVVVTFSDITERKVAEELLRDSEALKTSVLDSLAAHIAVLDRHGQIIAVNDAWRRYGRENEAPNATIEPVGVNYLAMCSGAIGALGGADNAESLAGILSVLEGRRDEFSLEYPCHSPGELRWFRMSVTRIRGPHGGAVVSHMPITDLKRAELSILAAQGELRATLEAVPDLLFEVGRDGSIHNFHSPRRDLLLVDPADFMGRRVADIMPPEASRVVDAALAQAAEAGHSSGLQYELALPNGSHWFELSVAPKPVPDGEAPRFICLARDVTERQQLEQQLREAQKIESIGTLAGGIAHDFNNILAAILGNVALARQDAAAGRPVQESLDQINRAGARARHLVQQILTFSRRDQHGFANQPLGPVVDETFGLLRATLPAGVRLDKVLPMLPLAVRGDSTQLQQVLMNLCTNAWHALPLYGGRIEVGAASLVPDEALRRQLPPLPTGQCVHLWVSDNGSGMDEATRQRIFDPFFTTKPVGQGTGLGLPVVHGIVRAHGGVITVESHPGQGTTFHLYFPEPDAGTAFAGGAAAAAAPAPGAGQQVLYVDDDDVMTVMVERLLARAGFRVTACTDPVAALAMLRERPQRFDAVVTDFNMPERSGIEVAREALRLRPGLPVVISSGYLNDALREQAAQAGVRALMRKENTIDELVELLQKLLRPALHPVDAAE